jgi:2-polyprenyl-3-methyl-5-hydroxy-6-metoxy-1,4-benzoquinol methylase
MTDSSNDDIIQAWEAHGDRAADFGDEGDFGRQHLLNPAIFELLGDVAGHNVLDAGCGQGYLARLLARRGARVTGVEPAEPWLRYAQERERDEPLGIAYARADLAAPDLPQRLSGPFDAVVANMVLMDIPRCDGAIRNCVAVLHPGGDFVFSLVHPCFEEEGAAWDDQRGVAVREYLREYSIPQAIGPRIHRPLSAYIHMLADVGAVVRRMIEPQLDAQFAALGPQHARNVHVPSFLIVHAVKL